VNRKIDFEGRDWAAHAQDHWLEFSGNPNFPDYLRIVFVAYGRHAANGHARLGQGELAQYLVRRDGTLPERRTTWSALAKAMDLGYLEPDSKMLCLVVPGEHVQGGKGNPDARCTRDHTRRNVGSGDRRSRQNVGRDAGRFIPNVGSGDRRLTLAPSLSSSTSTTDHGEPEVSA
jgi:hypothetical protein